MTEQEIYDIIPKEVETGIFVLGINDNPNRFIKLVVRELTNKPELQRAFLVFEKGIPKSETKRIVFKIGDTLNKKGKVPEGRDLHLRVISGISRKEIRRICDHYNKQGIVNLY